VLDTVHLDHPSLKIQPRPIPPRPKKRRSSIQGGYCLPALKAVAAARGYLAGQFPTLTIAALSCGSHKDSVGAAVVILRTEDSVLLADVLSGYMPLLSTARSMKYAVELIDAFQRSSTFELQIFGRVITPEKIFGEVVIPAL
jgi:hypothetical protein